MWEAWGPGRDNRVVENAFHDTWGAMGMALSIIFPDSGNNWFNVTSNVLFNNLASGAGGASPGGSSGVGGVQLKGYRQRFEDNIVADSALSSGVWLGESGGFSLGEATVARNVFFNFSQAGPTAPPCPGGFTSQSRGALCWRGQSTIVSATVGARLAALATNRSKQNPAWWNFSAAQAAAPTVVGVDANVYDAPLEPANGTLRTLRPDIDAHSAGGASAADVAFARTPFSQWWNRTHLDYALAPGSVALTLPVGLRPADLSAIGLDLSAWPFDPSDMFARDATRKVQVESADRAFGLYREPSFGLSFPRGDGAAAPPLPSAVAIFNRMDFGAAAVATRLRMRACTPLAVPGHVKAATAIVLREGAPDGPVVATVPLSPATTATANCGYIVGSYWLPGVENDDPAAMVTVDAVLEPGFRATGRKQLFLSLQGGGVAAIDWFWFV